MSDKQDILSKYQGKPYPPLQKKEEQTPQLVKEETPYQAIIPLKRSARNPRFKIVLGNGTSYGCSYVHLIDWTLTPDNTLTLTTSSRVFVIEGQHLEQIEQLLMEERIKELHEFNPKNHKTPTTDETKIEKVTIENQE